MKMHLKIVESDVPVVVMNRQSELINAFSVQSIVGTDDDVDSVKSSEAIKLTE